MQSSDALESGATSPPDPPNWFARRFRDSDPAAIALRVLRIGLFYLALLGIWQLVYNLEYWPSYVLPSPAEVWETFKKYVENGKLWDAVLLTMKHLIVGYAASLAIGFTVGMLCGVNKYIDETVGSLVLGMQSLPSVTWLPLAVLWFGLSDTAIYFVVLMGSVFAVAISARAGVQGIPPLYKRTAQTMGANRYQMLRYMLIPAMVPGMTQGLKLGWSFAWRSLMAAEILLGGQLSVGALLEIGRSLNDMDLVIMIMFVIVAIGLAVDRLFFARMEAWVQERWGLTGA